MKKSTWKQVIVLSSVLVLALGGLAACGKKADNAGGASTSPSTSASASPTTSAKPQVTGTVTASGSTALQPMVNLAADLFIKANPKATVQVTGGGSGKGVTNVATNVSDIGNSDVEASADLKDKLVDHIVCIAPFALVVSKDVTIDGLTKQQAADIFMGKVTNWKEVGGPDLKITLVQRQESSGSRKLVQQIILDNKDFSKEGLVQDSSKTVADAVSKGPGTIGYVDVPYVTASLKALKLDGTAYSADAIKSGKYPLYGTEHMYTGKTIKPETQAFLDYIMSKDFMSKKEVTDLGFLPADLLKK